MNSALKMHERSWLALNKWLIIRRASQFGILAAFLAGPLTGYWIVKGNLTSSLTFDVLPLSDPYVLLQTFAAGHVAATTAILGAAIVVAFYLLVGGRVYCAYVCPMNLVTDAARWLAKRFDLPKGWQPPRQIRLWFLGATLLAALTTGMAAWEFLNPVTILHRDLVYGMSGALFAIGGVFLFDLLVSRRGWCGHLCPMGAFYGVLGQASLTRISAANRGACDDCMDCFNVCPEPHVITPALRGEAEGTGPVILSGDCTNCARCIDVCDKRVFKFDHRFNNPIPPANIEVGESEPRRHAA